MASSYLQFAKDSLQVQGGELMDVLPGEFLGLDPPNGPITAIQLLSTVRGKIWLSVSSVNLRNSNDSEKGSDSTLWFKHKEIKVNERTGAMTVHFKMKTTSLLWTAYGQVWINGVAVGVEHTTNSEAYQEFFDLIGPRSKDDLIQIYGKIQNNIANVRFIDQRLHYDRAMVYLGEKNLSAALAITTPQQAPFSVTNQDPW